MSEYDPRCLNCFHRSHENKPCTYCDANNRCTEFVRADLFAARTLGRIENNMMRSHAQLMSAISTFFDLITEIHPEAAESLSKKLEERQKVAEAEVEAHRAQVEAAAAEALKTATAADEERVLAELAEGYTKKDNVLPFRPIDVIGTPAIISPEPEAV